MQERPKTIVIKMYCCCIGERAGGRRQVTEVEALRAMQRLCSRIASQKMLVISSLENDCSKEELNRQIAVTTHLYHYTLIGNILTNSLEQLCLEACS